MKHAIRILNRRELVAFAAVPADVITPEYIGHVLSQINRYGGHTPYPYSVAQHAVFVSHLVPKRLAYEGLHHDDTEVITSDVINPVKTDEIRAIERNIRAQIAPMLGLAEEEPPAVKEADLRALAFEQGILQGDPYAEIADLDRGRFTHLYEIVNALRRMHPARAAEAFVERHYELRAEMDGGAA